MQAIAYYKFSKTGYLYIYDIQNGEVTYSWSTQPEKIKTSNIKTTHGGRFYFDAGKHQIMLESCVHY